jgi:hypothetical protein
MLIRLLFLLISILSITSVSAQTTKEHIEWNEFYELRWDDFRGKPADDAAGDAGTSVQIQAKPYKVKDNVKYDVYTLFNREKSWSRDQSAQLLVHEQLHFDLAEVFARKIRKKIREMTEAGVRDIKAINTAIQAILEESNEADLQYDLETLHGALDQKQALWARKIQDELVALKSYKKHKRVITSGS